MRFLVLVVAAACARNVVPGGPGPDLSAYREPADRIIAAALADDGAYRKLAQLTDRVGAYVLADLTICRYDGVK